MNLKTTNNICDIGTFKCALMAPKDPMSTPLSGLTWTSNTITWAFAAPGAVPNLGTVTSTIFDPAQQAAVTVGINDWTKISGVNLVQITDPSQANIQVGYGNPAGL